MFEHGFIQMVASSGRLAEAVQIFDAAVCYTDVGGIMFLYKLIEAI